MKKIEFANTVEALCKRPAMYTMHGTFAEIVACLDGYAKGAEVKDGLRITAGLLSKNGPL
jgi:hypothetical protein